MTNYSLEFLSLIIGFTYVFIILHFIVKNNKVKYFKILVLSITALISMYLLNVILFIPSVNRTTISYDDIRLRKAPTNQYYTNPGVQHIAIAPMYNSTSKDFKNPSFFSFLNLDYNTDTNGFVIGTPAIYYTGFFVLYWEQFYISPVHINQQNGTSEFTVGLISKSLVSSSNYFDVTIFKDGKMNIHIK